MKKIQCLLAVPLAISIQFARGAEMPGVIDRYCRVIVPVIFPIALIGLFVLPRG
jgi:cadmium resistance protein CadD (predicted permease)